jgi:uncharacterized C2H2 Zn-finger protein
LLTASLQHLEVGCRHDETEVPMALKCVTCGLLFRSRNELDWHVREEHLQPRLPPAEGQPAPPAAAPKDRR